ncbi:UDP-glucose 4-epimerase GalE [Candidatus Sumerlaeota bacterium]|nr:UDP-glucose 4-epimerase GalE [Candidatus Sumerlaeota bacterium]
MKILVTGGAGYIGSVTVDALRERGDSVVVVDNLMTGHRAAVDADVPFFATDLRSTAEMEQILQAHKIEAVIHFAASSLVGESVSNPAKYFDNNVGGTMSLLAAMRAAGVSKIIFSSTAATYGEPERVPIPETHRTSPTNPYGMTKLMMEQIMGSYASAYGLKFAALRYFNACGATPSRGEHHEPESHLIPLILFVALGKRPSISIFGNDYDTPDGTCIRDYVHVSDLARAHLAALDYLERADEPLICNLGNGSGYSVKEVIDMCRQVTEFAIPVVVAPRRAGDPSRLVADPTLAREKLGWKTERSGLREIVIDAWTWHAANPDGYGG